MDDSKIKDPFHYFKEILDSELLFQLMPEIEKEFILNQLRFISDKIMQK